MGTHEPVHRVDVVAERLGDDLAVGGPPELPLGKPLRVVGGWRQSGLLAGHAALEEVRVHEVDGPDLAGVDQALRVAVDPSVSLLEAEGDVQVPRGRVREPHDPLRACEVCRSRLFYVDVLPGLDRGFEVVRVHVDGCGDDHGVNITGQDLPHVLVEADAVQRDALAGPADRLVRHLRRGDHLGLREARDVACVAAASPAKADDPDRHC